MLTGAKMPASAIRDAKLASARRACSLTALFKAGGQKVFLPAFASCASFPPRLIWTAARTGGQVERHCGLWILIVWASLCWVGARPSKFSWGCKMLSALPPCYGEPSIDAAVCIAWASKLTMRNHGCAFRCLRSGAARRILGTPRVRNARHHTPRLFL